ncbi:biotin--[acetyl-CoA-carboxylase] ligase [Hyperthermus butylicus]|uniref:Biotin/lipoate A/B protein ligase n=1 Tax=Hyperthermus butylicus (strain DSM 5456 / JCM 9403 / PLM1-5) TaxID=415426 RepID=A2BLY4_HYPBU|nr:biotin--[acetyl-CoA-carboxylase] ligase [Hyperthermus butylicus]ABM80995.1 putative Biotin/lipoate A/B protein ligase [Hyperthermus butylicus DSM 5456]
MLGQLSVLEVYDAIDTTMDATPPRLPAAVAALTQRRGRGRTGAWHSPRGGAWITVFLNAPPDPRLPTAVGGYLAGLLEEFLCGAVHLTVKWPNDVYAGGRKLAGILVEHRAGMLRVGVGVNVYNEPPPGATSLAQLGYGGPLALVYAAIIEAVMRAAEDPAGGVAEAAARDMLWGCRVAIESPEGLVEGVARGITSSGALLVETGEGTVELACCHVKAWSCSNTRPATKSSPAGGD